MDAIWRLFTPLGWAMREQTLITCIVLAVATLAAFWGHWFTSATVLGCALGTAMMLRAERDNPANAVQPAE